MISALLKPFGKEKDNCMVAILEYFNEHKGTWINKAELSLLQFPYVEKGIRKHFAPETIARKARELATYPILERKEWNHQTFYKWPEQLEVPKRTEYVPVMREGRIIRIPVLV